MQRHMRILVTGGAGFLGSHLADRLMEENTEVVVLDNLQAGKLENINKHMIKSNFQFVQGDIRDPELVRRLVKDVDAVFHLAAIVSVALSIENPALVNDVNVNGTLNLLKASTDSGIKRFVFASSSAVYGETKHVPITEQSTLRPISPYGVSKMAAESYVRVFNDVFGLSTVCLRFFNVYGPRQAFSAYSNVITQFLNRIQKNQDLTIFGDGDQTRDFIHAQDIVEASLQALRTDRIGGEVFNIGTGKATTITQLAELLLKVTGKTRLKVKHSEPRKGDIKYSTADISRARSKLHYSPTIALEAGLKELTKSD